MMRANAGFGRTVFLALGLVAGLAAAGDAPPPPPKAATKPSLASSPWPLERLFQAPAVEWLDKTSPVRSLLYAGEPFQGRPTQVFAYYATPATLAAPAKAETRFPGIVLIHGGGGTAFKEWAALWARRGYAALAMDLAGSRPDDADPKKVTRLPNGGPAQDDAAKFDALRTPDVSDDWPYHAVANAVLAHSLLRSFPEVDADRTAVTGISWGGYACCLVASLDSRFKAAVPVYGCGFLHENSAWLAQLGKLGPELTKRWVQLYDPSSYLPQCRVPLFFVNGTNDFAYPLDSYAKSYRAAAQAPRTVRLQVKMPHGHEPGWAPAEIGRFVDSLLHANDAKPLPQCGEAVVTGERVTAKVQSAVPVKAASLHYAVPGQPINQREWVTLPATVKNGTGPISRHGLEGASQKSDLSRFSEVVAEAPPPLADVLFFSLTDEQGATVSSPPTVREAITVFDAPGIQAAEAALAGSLVQLAQAKKLAEAEALLANAVKDRRLDTAANRYNLACAQALQGKADAALGSLATAVARGWADAEHLRKDPDLESLRKLPRFEELAKSAEEKAKQAKPPQPAQAEVRDGVALVSEANTNWAPQVQQFLVLHTFPPADPAKPITTQGGAIGNLLRQWQKEGTAAGLHGFLYDNHDRDHSNMDTGAFPQLARVEYAEPARRHGFDHGLQHLFLHNVPTLGNSSTAIVSGAIWGSQTRLALRRAPLVNVLALQYLNNLLYLYPEHRDHDADNHGDAFHANVPYVLTSQGSSGSDRPFLHAIACTLAAFRPETQRALIEKKLLMPTVQMIFRKSNKPVVAPEDYLTGKAHPPVFAAEALDVEKMVRAAHEMKPDEIPPLLRLRVVEEDRAQAGVDYFDAGDAEKVFDTPCALARVARAARWQRRLVVSAEDTKDPNNRPLAFHWRLLCGDPERVKITPLNPEGTRAELLVAWHERRPAEPESKLLTCRVDIGVFAHNGAHDSAPAFVSWYFPANEKRVYDEAHRIVSIERFRADGKEHYADPSLVTPALWRDEYRHDPQGRLLGWTRTREGKTEQFTRDGALVTKADAQGRPVEARTVRYVREQKTPNDWPVLRQELGTEVLTYSYQTDNDLLGVVSRGSSPKE